MKLNKNEIQFLAKMSGGFYEDFKREFLYHSNHMEGSTFTPEALELLMSKREVIGEHSYIDVIETKNSLDVFDEVIRTLDDPLDKFLILDFHRVLKRGTSDEEIGISGKWKPYENRITKTDLKLAKPEQVDSLIGNLLYQYEQSEKELTDIVHFHAQFELIHPFNDGNGRIGRFLMLRQCIEANIDLISVDSEYNTQYRDSLYQAQKCGEEQELVGIFEKCQNRLDAKLEFYKPMIEDIQIKLRSVDGEQYDAAMNEKNNVEYSCKLIKSIEATRAGNGKIITKTMEELEAMENE